MVMSSSNILILSKLAVLNSGDYVLGPGIDNNEFGEHKKNI